MSKDLCCLAKYVFITHFKLTDIQKPYLNSNYRETLNNSYIKKSSIASKVVIKIKFMIRQMSFIFHLGIERWRSRFSRHLKESDNRWPVRSFILGKVGQTERDEGKNKTSNCYRKLKQIDLIEIT